MPNFKKTTQPKKQKSKSNVKNNNDSKSRGPPHGSRITWGSSEPPKKEETYTQKNFYFIIAGIIFLFLFCLWAFVPDQATIERNKAAREAAQARANQTQSEKDYQIKEFTFEHAQLFNTTQFTETMKSYQENDEDDRIILVAFDDSTRDAEGSPTKVRLFRKYENIAKSLPRKKVFKRYEKEELPLIIAFDCGNPEDQQAESLCKQIIGENIPNVVIFRPKQQPRALPNEYRSDNQIITYLYNLMQPAVRYLEELKDVEEFVANDAQMNVVLFGDEKTGSFDQVADLLREFARFGKTRATDASREFDVEMNSILVWKTFGSNPNHFNGNISDSQSVYSYIMNNYLPVFGEFNPTTSNRYMKRGLPIVWIAYDRYADDSKDILETAEKMAHRYLGAMSFVHLDVKSYPQIANNFGIDVTASDADSSGRDGDDDDDEDDENKKGTDEDDQDSNENTNKLPQVFIMNQMAQLREFVDSKNVEDSIEKVCDEYMRLARAARGEGLTELDTNDDDGDESEFEEDDDEDEVDEVDLGSGEYDEDEDEEDDVVQPPKGEATQEAGKQDL